MTDSDNPPGRLIPFPTHRAGADGDPNDSEGIVSCRKRLVLESATRGMPGLVALLERLCDLELDGRYYIEMLYRLGAHFAVFQGTDSERDEPLAIKLPLLNYTRPASFGLRRVKRARKMAMREWKALNILQEQTDAFPRPIALVRTANPLLKRRGDHEEWQRETFLVQEWIDCGSLDDMRQRLFADDDPDIEYLEQAVLEMSRALLKILDLLLPRIYADVAPRNFLWCATDRRLRVVDAGSLVDADSPLWEAAESDPHSGTILTPVTMCYLPEPAVHARRDGRGQHATEELMLGAVGKMLHELSTNLHPIEGEDPSLSCEAFRRLPDGLRSLIEALVTGELSSVQPALEAVCELTERNEP